MTWDHEELWGKHPAVTSGKQRMFGQRAADFMKRMLANWGALGLTLSFITVWMVFNSHVSHERAFDPFPWILLNLCLSCFAALQCFILLIANKRGEQIASEVAQHTLENTQYLNELLERNTELTETINSLTQELHAHILKESS